MAERVAIITGAGRGIGRATAIELSQRGYRCVLVARNPEHLAETSKLAPDSLVAPADVVNVQQIQDVVTKAIDAFGRIDAIVNNAGLAPVQSIEEMTPEGWRDVIETNLSAAFYLSKAVWPHFKRQKSGVVVNISSLAARDPFGGFLAYGAAKAGVNTFSLALAREGAPLGIRVHTIAPGATETAMFRSLFTEQQFGKERTMNPSEVAHVIADCITGPLAHTSGEVIWLHKTV